MLYNMSMRSLSQQRWCGALAAIAALAGAAAALAADPIYKCVDASARVTYQSEPCRGGQRLDVDAGVADPAAVARLERRHEADQAREAEQRAVERAVADRMAERRADAMAQALAAQLAAGAPPPDAGEGCLSCWGWNYLAPVEPTRPPKPPKPHPLPAAGSIVVPKASAPARPVVPPPLVPR
jgi:hypothetical protein